MFKSFLISMFAVLLFALGATGAWFYMNLEKEESKEDELPVAMAAPKEPPSPIPKFSDIALPAVARPSDLTMEEMHRLKIATEEQRDQLIEYEKKLKEQSRRIKTSNADTATAQREVEGALEQLQGMLDATEKLLNEVVAAKEAMKKQAEELQMKKEELEKKQEEVGAGKQANIRAFAEILAGLEPGKTAETFVEQANSGQMDLVLQIISELEPRIAAKIYGEIDDAPLRAEIATLFSELSVVR